MLSEQNKSLLYPSGVDGQKFIPYRIESETSDGFDPESGLFNIEIDLGTQLLNTCERYMSPVDYDFVKRSLHFALRAHSTHARESGLPYSEHLLTVANMAADYQLDALIVAGGLLHDVLEDEKYTHVTEKDIVSALYDGNEQAAGEFVSILRDISKLKSRNVRKAQLEEEYKMTVIESYINNPRVAIIKIFDKVHNMRTLGSLSDERKIKNVRETQEIFIPLALRLGMYKEAEELGRLCVYWQTEKGGDLVDEIDQKRKQLQSYVTNEDIEDIVSIIGTGDVQARARIANTYEVFNRKGDEAELKDTHMYVHLDIIVPIVMDTINPSLWGKQLEDILGDFRWSEQFNVDQKSYNTDLFNEETKEHLTDSIQFRMSRVSDQLGFSVHVYPKDAYRRELAFIPHLFTLDPSVTTEQKALAADKLEHTREYYTRESESGIPHSARAARLLEPRTPEGYMRVQGKDDEGRIRSLTIPQNSTILDYTKSFSPHLWPKTLRATINGQQVQLNTTVGPNDVIHTEVSREKGKIYDPMWIHFFHTDPDGAEEVRHVNKERIKEEELNMRKQYADMIRHLLDEKGVESKRIQALLSRVNQRKPGRLTYFHIIEGIQKTQRDTVGLFNVLYGIVNTSQTESLLTPTKIRVSNTGRWKIEQHLLQAERPLLVGLSRVLSDIHDYDGLINEGEFLLKVGFDEVPASIVASIAQKIGPVNAQVGILAGVFERDATGQGEAVLKQVSSQLGINLLKVVMESKGKDAHTNATLYVDPDDYFRLPEIATALSTSEECIKLGFVGEATLITTLSHYTQYNL
ncbi:bifunctional (p)ppGpp synthetase/guanosine-3',5'-bis(diphosphate) 3'-pyrophosphohydrolase [Candidatus Roizmanbacteria bacterium]|nr:bifunctional (p)ppGpp synthetase/guanosine-3',5'-bis(diphosphate) 3'-pyrophosphohydrolase [Candidatus Roizmanbacteria bacterium]